MMKLTKYLSAVGRWPVLIGSVLLVTLSVGFALGRAQAQQQAPAQTFDGDAGMISVIIKPDKTGDFENVVAKLKAGLLKGSDERKKQAAGWKIFRSTAPGPQGNVVYVFFIDPVVPNADYTVSKILYGANAIEAQQTFEMYRGAFVGQLPQTLKLVAHLGQ
jgi:hypothetical protein